MIYGDSSFLLRLLSHEAGSEHAVSVFRRLGRPALAFAPLHEIEVRNGLRLKVFMEMKSRPTAAGRTALHRDLETWEARLDRFLERGTLTALDVPWDRVIASGLRLSQEQSLRLGPRAYDILHVAMSLELGVRTFVTCDRRQAKLARSAGLKVTLAAVE